MHFYNNIGIEERSVQRQLHDKEVDSELALLKEQLKSMKEEKEKQEKLRKAAKKNKNTKGESDGD